MRAAIGCGRRQDDLDAFAGWKGGTQHGTGGADELVRRGGDTLADVDDLGGRELRNIVELHVIGAETLDIHLAGPIDRNLDDVRDRRETA